MKTNTIQPSTNPKNYDENFKRQALEHWLASGKPAIEVADALGISTFSLYSWKKKFITGSTGGDGHAPVRTVEALEAEILSVRRELEYTRQQRDILKKTLGILCDNPINAMNGSKR